MLPFVIINIIFSVFRNTYARVLTLLVAMGYGILVSSVAKHHAKIAVLTLLYFASNIVYLVSLYINKTSPLSPAV
jgi:hypothetical protein